MRPALKFRLIDPSCLKTLQDQLIKEHITLVTAHRLDFFNHLFISVLLLNFSDVHDGPLVPMVGHRCILLLLLAISTDVSHLYRMEAAPLFLEVHLLDH